MNEYQRIVFSGLAVGLAVTSLGGIAINGSAVVNLTLAVLATIALIVSRKGRK